MIAFVAVGYVFLGFSAHTPDIGLGEVLYWAGFTIWIPGVMFTLLGYYRRGERRGDW
jgi:O-antigen/teichoic acid export membrane protein